MKLNKRELAMILTGLDTVQDSMTRSDENEMVSEEITALIERFETKYGKPADSFHGGKWTAFDDLLHIPHEWMEETKIIK